MNETKSFAFEKLNNGNYSTWSFRMRHFLNKEGIFGTLETDEEITAAQQPNDVKAMSFIALSVDNDNLVHIIKCTSGRDAWKKLKRVHVQTTLTSQIRLMRQLFSTSLSDNLTMQEHLGKIFELFNRLADSGFIFESKISVSIVLSSLSIDYEPLITALEAWDEDKLTLEDVRAKLIEEFSRKYGNNQAETNETVLKANQRQCAYCKNRGHIEINCRTKMYHQSRNNNNVAPGPSRGRAHVACSAFVALEEKARFNKRKTSKRICYHCSQRGHYSSTCPTKPSLQSEIGVNNRIQDEIKDIPSAKTKRWNNMCSLVSLNHPNKFQGFVLDSGCSSHMCCDETLFTDLKYGSFGEITVASGAVIRAKGLGTIHLVVGKGNQTVELKLLNVLFVPDINTNLLSISKITKKNFSVIFTSTGCHLKGPAGTFLIGTFSNGLYSLIQPRKQSANSSKSPSELKEEDLFEFDLEDDTNEAAKTKQLLEDAILPIQLPYNQKEKPGDKTNENGDGNGNGIASSMEQENSFPEKNQNLSPISISSSDDTFSEAQEADYSCIASYVNEPTYAHDFVLFSIHGQDKPTSYSQAMKSKHHKSRKKNPTNGLIGLNDDVSPSQGGVGIK